jgi:hypothetical protein
MYVFFHCDCAAAVIMKLRIWSGDQRQEKWRRKSGFPGVAWHPKPHHFRTKCSHFYSALWLLSTLLYHGETDTHIIMNGKKCVYKKIGSLMEDYAH